MDTIPLPALRDNSFSRLNIDTGEWEPESLDDGPLPPLPPPAPAPFNFNREKLTLEIRQKDAFDLNLAGITSRTSKLQFRTHDGADFTPSREWFAVNGGALNDELDAAAWETFQNRRFWRGLLFGIEQPNFDLIATLEAGATLDWHLGAVQWPKEKPLLKSAVPIFEVADTGETADLVAERYLCRGGSILLTGPTGIGKSSLAMQLAIAWGLGKPCLGFEPSQPIATLFIQAENDAGDVQEARDGIVAGMGLGEGAEAVLNEMISVATVDDATGDAFFTRLQYLIRQWQPDLIVLDPLLAYVGGDVNRQDVAAAFLRTRLNPILHRANVGCMVVHHEGKPARDGTPQGNPNYAGLGSSELSNWARAICSLTIEGDAFCLTLGKRGKRAGIQDEFGATRVWLRHAANVIFWEEADAASVPSAKRAKSPEDLLPHVPASPGRILKASLIEKCKGAGIGENRSRAFLGELIEAAKLYLHREKRPGTNPVQYIARHPQEPQKDLPT